ncbi:MAG: 4Fe-4S binding protein [Chloroflexota bacterium]
MRARLRLAIGVLTLLVPLAVLFWPVPRPAASDSPRQVTIEASQYSFSPAVVRVERGELVTLRLEALDAVHGLWLDGYELAVTAEPGQSGQLTFRADREGKFVLRCSATCGPLHPFMVGELEVAPNLPFARAAFAALVVAVGAAAFWLSAPILPLSAARRPTWRYELTRLQLLRTILRSRWLPWGLTVVTLAFLVVALLAGFFGTPVGNRNFAVVFIWIVWWALLMLVLVPLAGRAWCAVCPLPVPGEWLQRRALVEPRAGGRLFTRGWRWPARLRSLWPQNAGFLGLALFSVVILTSPWWTAAILLTLVGLAVATSLLWRGRVFCRYLCPVGGFIGLYADLAPLALRVRDAEVCARHREKPCLAGSAAGYGCPWSTYPGNLENNAPCGLCAECFKTCSLDNVGLFLQTPAAAVAAGSPPRSDGTYKTLIMLTCALAYSLVLLGPWPEPKAAASEPGTLAWLAYAGVLLVANLALMPAVFFACAALAGRLGRCAQPAIVTWRGFGQALLPLGLGAWGAFSLGFALANGSYVWGVLSDPFGWGWNLFGTADWVWQPLASGAMPYAQTLLLLGGLLGAVWIAARYARGLPRPGWGAAPMIAFCTATTLVFLGLYVG